MATSGRKPKNTTVIDVIDPALDQPKIQGAMQQMRSDASSIALAQAQHESAVRAVASQVGYLLPADCTDPDLIQRDISANMRRSVEACLEVGRGLAVLKTAAGHGNFIDRLDILGIERRVAQRFMASAVRFSNAVSTPLLQAAGNQTKLFEMLVLDDDQVDELLLLGQTGELKLDEIASMSVKELRANLRELSQEKQATEQLLADKNTKIDQLKKANKRIQAAPPDVALAELHKEATAIASDALGCLRGQLRQALLALKDHTADGTDGTDNTLFMAGLVGQVQYDLTALRTEFDLPDLSTAAEAALAAEVAQWAK